MKRQKNPPSIQNLIDESKTSVDASRFLFALTDSNDRACGIVGGAVIDDALGNAILSYLVKDDELEESLFRFDNGPLGSFSAKINMGYALGIFGERTHSDMHCIRPIRNAFAHIKSDIDFTHEGIVGICERLTVEQLLRGGTTEYQGRPFAPARLKYIDSITCFWFRLQHATSAGKRPDVYVHLP
jgi:hypothetical protein